MHVSCLSVFVCAHRYEASSQVLCSSEKITLCARFQPPARDKTCWQPRIVISSCLSNVASQCTCTHTHTHIHRCCQQFPSFQTPLTPKWDRVCQLVADNPPTPPRNPHTLFHSPISKPSTFFPINFLKRLFTLLNFSCLRVRVCIQQWQNLNNLKHMSALHHRSSISTKHFTRETHIHTLAGWRSIVSPPAFRQATSCSSCLQQAGPPLVSPSASSPLFQLSSWESANPTV